MGDKVDSTQNVKSSFGSKELYAFGDLVQKNSLKFYFKNFKKFKIRI
jgi:hypothetical protein